MMPRTSQQPAFKARKKSKKKAKNGRRKTRAK